MKNIESNFGIIELENNIIRLYDIRPKCNLYDNLLENVKISITDDKILTLEGDEISFGFCIHKTFVEDMKKKPKEQSCYYGYKSIIDFFKKRKKPYVKYRYELEERSESKIEMSDWSLIYNN